MLIEPHHSGLYRIISVFPQHQDTIAAIASLMEEEGDAGTSMTQGCPAHAHIPSSPPFAPCPPAPPSTLSPTVAVFSQRWKVVVLGLMADLGHNPGSVVRERGSQAPRMSCDFSEGSS